MYFVKGFVHLVNYKDERNDITHVYLTVACVCVWLQSEVTEGDGSAANSAARIAVSCYSCVIL